MVLLLKHMMFNKFSITSFIFISAESERGRERKEASYTAISGLICEMWSERFKQ